MVSEDPPIAPSDDAVSDLSADDLQVLLAKIVKMGWLLLILSIVFLYFSSGVIEKEGGESILPSICLMISRLCGIGAFLVGALAIFLRRWLTGLSLFVLSVLLPLVAFHLHGTI